LANQRSVDKDGVGNAEIEGGGEEMCIHLFELIYLRSKTLLRRCDVDIYDAYFYSVFITYLVFMFFFPWGWNGETR
jgi:hypothetical protein